MRPKRSKLRLVATKIFVLFATCALLIAIFSVRFEGYRSSLRNYDKAQESNFLVRDFSPLSDAAVIQLGTAHTPENRPASSYQLSRETKGPGVIRIGVFGCSFARGAETTFGGDFPTLLEDQLRTATSQDVEVVNFGVGGYGLQQSYLMWQELAERYDLDATVFHVFSFHRERDTTFVQLNDSYGPLHARYALDKRGNLMLIPVLGNDRRHALETYFRLIPPWRYIRYDSKPPAVLRSLVPRGRALTVNPFYYTREPGELDRIYQQMFSEIASRSSQLIIGCNNPGMFEYTQGLPGLRERSVMLSVPRLSWHMPALYRAVQGHLSALGNRLAAEEYSAVLRADHGAVLELAFRDGNAAHGDAVPDRPANASLDTALEVSLVLDREPLGVFTYHDGRLGHTTLYDFKKAKTRALLDLSVGSELIFLTMPDEIEHGGAVEIVIESVGGERRSIAWGRVDAPAGVLGSLPGPSKAQATKPVAFEFVSDGGRLAVTVEEPGAVESVEISVGGRLLLRGRPSPESPSDPRARVVPLVPTTGRFLTVRAHPLQSPDILDRLGTGTVALDIRFRESESWSLPLFQMSTRHQALPLQDPQILTPFPPGPA
jgi:hypothetical protein